MDVWGIDSAVFWWCLAVAGALPVCGYTWAQLMSPRRARSADMSTSGRRSIYELAYLNGGAHLAITAAAARLHQAPDAEGEDELERSLFGALRAAREEPVYDLRGAVAASKSMARLDATLMEAGHLRAHRAAWLEMVSAGAGFALMAVALVRFAAEAHIGLTRELLLDAAFIGAFVVIVRSGHAHRLTRQGRDLLEHRRRFLDALRTPHSQSNLPLAVALFGGGVLWHANPQLAARWEVPREECPTGVAAARGGCGGGSCSDDSSRFSCG